MNDIEHRERRSLQLCSICWEVVANVTKMIKSLLFNKKNVLLRDERKKANDWNKVMNIEWEVTRGKKRHWIEGPDFRHCHRHRLPFKCTLSSLVSNLIFQMELFPVLTLWCVLVKRSVGQIEQMVAQRF